MYFTASSQNGILQRRGIALKNWVWLHDALLAALHDVQEEQPCVNEGWYSVVNA